MTPTKSTTQSTSAEAEGDIRLAAAAEMLAALNFFLRHGPTDDFIKLAISAVLKAEGRSL